MWGGEDTIIERNPRAHSSFLNIISFYIPLIIYLLYIYIIFSQKKYATSDGHNKDYFWHLGNFILVRNNKKTL